MKMILLLCLVGKASAEPAPFYPRDTKANQDLGGINQNFDDLANKSNCNMTQTITPKTCPAGQALVGACFSRGAIVGGTCGVVASSATAGTYGDSSHTVTITVNASGAITFISSQSIAASGGNNTSTSSQTFTNDVTVVGKFSLGTTTGSYTGGNGTESWYMKSADGATQSSGCVVVVAMNSIAGADGDPGTLVFTSTNTTVNPVIIGVLLETCAPAQICRVAMHGPARIITSNTASYGHIMGTSGATRCYGTDNGGVGSGVNGTFISANSGAGQAAWVFLGTH